MSVAALLLVSSSCNSFKAVVTIGSLSSLSSPSSKFNCLLNIYSNLTVSHTLKIVLITNRHDKLSLPLVSDKSINLDMISPQIAEMPRIIQFQVVNGSLLSFVTEIRLTVIMDVDRELIIVSQNKRVDSLV